MHSTTSTVDLSDRDSKGTLIVKEEEKYDAGAFEKDEAEVVKLLKEPQSSVEPPPGSSMSPLDHLCEIERGPQQRCIWSHQQ